MYGRKRFLGGTVLLLSFLVLGSSAFAQVRLTASTLSFGNQAVNQSSAALSATLKNTQGVPLSISRIAISGGSAPADYVAGGNCPLLPSTLGAGENCRITVTFTPSAPGMRTATLTVTDDAGTNPLTVAMTGMGVAPVDQTPNSSNFGALAVGSTSATPSGTLRKDLAHGRPGTLPGRVSGGPILVPLSGAGNANGLLSITVTPANPSIPLGETQQFTATGHYQGGSTKNLTASVLWNSSAPGVATINAAGLASSVSLGSTTITATLVTATPFAQATGVTPGTPISNPLPVSPISGSTTLTVTAGFVLTGSLNTARENHTATLLNNGTVLVAGGYNGSSGVLASAELYNPATGTFTATGSLNTARENHTATLLNNGMVLMAGGYNTSSATLASAELYNPATGTFTPTGSMNTARSLHTATLLNNGMVLIAGGYNGSYLASAELYNPATGTFSYASGSLDVARYWHRATLLNNGLVLIAGGFNSSSDLASAELYDPTTGTFTYTGSLNTARVMDTATLLNNGRVLIAAGSNCCGILASGELYEPATLTPPNLVAIDVTPATSTLSPGTTQQFIATGTFSDSSTEQLASVTWSSSDTTVAQISNDVTNRGMSLAIAAGSVTITATAGSVSGSATLTVQ
jgi:hypothetical protein